MENNITLINANTLFKKGKYRESLNLYELLKNKEQIYEEIVQANISICKRKIKENNSRIRQQKKEKIKFNSFGVIKHNPLVSIIIVSFNSGKDLETLLPTIKNQTYQNFEIVLLENGLEDTKKICDKYNLNLQYYKENNIGFAAGNNFCYEKTKGELLALVNPDTRLKKDFLQEMIDSIRLDESVAIVAPKINFFEKYITLIIEGEKEFEINPCSLMNFLNYKKYFIRVGCKKGNVISSNKDGIIQLDIPHPPGKAIIENEISFSSGFKRIKITIGFESKWTLLKQVDDKYYVEIAFDEKTFGSAKYLINNAGSGVREDGLPYDRGYGEYENGQYLSKIYLSAFCGCAALIRRAALINRKIFIDEFFAYYEDSELSWWVQQNNYRILYCPTAVVYHRHSESTEENSILWTTLVSRSHQIYKSITNNQLKLSVSNFRDDYIKLNNSEISNRLVAHDTRISETSFVEDLYVVSKKTLCIYNTYFFSMGGGEKHCLDFAEILQQDYDVHLVSEVNFEVDELSRYFDVDLRRCKKIISTNIDEHFTSKFDIFINSTFRSNLISYAFQSYYIVSFPHWDANTEILNKYHFIHNSSFTQRWANKYWGSHSSSLILPIIGCYKQDASVSVNKKRKLLSVGRLTSEGHCKNHHLIIDAFKNCIDDKFLTDWELVIAGSCDLSNKKAFEYYEAIITSSVGYNITILINVDRAKLEELYSDAFIYVHATGLGLPETQPELHEHFGITPHEAIKYGCIPIVYFLGGPAEHVSKIKFHRIFDSLNQLKNCLIDTVESFPNSVLISKEISNYSKLIEFENFNFANNFFSINK